MQYKFLLTFFTIYFTISCINADDDEANYDDAIAKDFNHFCSFDHALMNHDIADDEDFCDCDVTSNYAGHNIVGKPMVKIDCGLSDSVNLTNAIFHAEILPVNTVSLILSFQQFTEIPEFNGTHLVDLDMSNNQITVIKDLNFIYVTSLELLDLSYNVISDIQSNAFSLLQLLHQLNLIGNRLMILPTNVFSPLPTLKTLKLSGNVGFGRVLGADVSNSSLTELYLHLGVTPQLNELIMERCNLTRINLLHGLGLQSLNLGHNNITDFSEISFPANLQKLDLSANPVREFSAKSLPHMYSLVELVLEDMPYLETLKEYSLYGFPYLQRLTLEGSKNLSKIDGRVFGINVITNETDLELKTLNLRGCNLRSLNESLLLVFDHLEELCLDGNPFDCDCDVQWIKALNIETDLQCSRPDELSGKRLSDISDSDLECSKMSIFVKKFINILILLVLLVGCSLLIWCFFQQLNPNKRNNFQKVSPESPYQRVTIEPNRAE